MTSEENMMEDVERLRRDWLCYQWGRVRAELEQAVTRGDETHTTGLRDFIAFCEREAARTGHAIVATPRGPRFKRMQDMTTTCSS